MAPKETSYYDLLQVSPTATPAEIRKSFRVLALKHHPDRAGNSGAATAFFARLRAVHDVLTDPARRAEYDEEGDVGTLFSGDASSDIDPQRTGPAVSPEDIEQYEHVYRNGPDEREDLSEFFKRFDGGVSDVLDYIPYSDASDLVRFVRFWDDSIANAALEDPAAYKRHRKRLLRLGKGKERDLSSEAAGNAADGDGKTGAADSAGASAGKAGKKSRSNKLAKPAGGVSDLAAQILGRRKKREGQFDAWVDGLAARAEQRVEDDKKKRKRKPRKGATADGGVRKKRRAKS